MISRDVVPRDQVAVTMSWLMTPSGIDNSQELVSAVVVALGTDMLAEVDDTLPDINNDDRRGWWGDLDAAAIWGGWPIGNRLWLLARAKITDSTARQGSTIPLIRTYLYEALTPFITAGIASKVDVAVARNGRERIDAVATLYRGPLLAISLQFQDLWAGIAS